MNFNKLSKLSGDASFRKFYRHKKNNSIIVYCKKNKFKNLVVYEAINRLLKKCNIQVPTLIKESYKKNYIEITDLGNITGLKNFKVSNYVKLFNILIKFEKISQRTIKTFNKKIYKIPIYTKNLLYEEAKLFTQWYLPKIIHKNSEKISIELNFIIKRLIRKLKLTKKVFVHRDFHISNFMIKNDLFFLIDTQDAVYGNEAYDFASLIDDVRVKVSLKNREKLYNKFILIKKNIDKHKFRNDFEILSILRNLKIIGIFTRLSMRDKKSTYLKLIPYAWKMIDERRNVNPNFMELNIFLNKYLKKKIKKKK